MVRLTFDHIQVYSTITLHLILCTSVASLTNINKNNATKNNIKSIKGFSTGKHRQNINHNDNSFGGKNSLKNKSVRTSKDIKVNEDGNRDKKEDEHKVVYSSGELDVIHRGRPKHIKIEGEDDYNDSEDKSEIKIHRDEGALAIKQQAKENSDHLDTGEVSYFNETNSEMERGLEVEREADTLKRRLLVQEKMLYEEFEEVEVGEGDSLLRDLKQYNNDLMEFLNMAVADKPNTYAVVKDFLDPNQPVPHVAKMEFAKEALMENFRWSEQDFDRFQKLFHNTTETFFELQLSHHEFPYR
uniref:Uncharacterized protein n=1 Tax=Clastoptera arizonana TaxID=38151 RepID=A0A1B6DZS1_9HEMI